MKPERNLDWHPLRLSGVNLIRERRAREAEKRRDNYFALSVLTMLASIFYVSYLAFLT